LKGTSIRIRPLCSLDVASLTLALGSLDGAGAADAMPTRRHTTAQHAWVRPITETAQNLGLCSTIAHGGPSDVIRRQVMKTCGSGNLSLVPTSCGGNANLYV